MHQQTYSPGLTAATTTARALLAAGWIYDSTSPMANDTTIRSLLHGTGREIHARTVDGGELTDLTLTGLTLEQVAGAITGAGLAPAAPTAPTAQPAPDYWRNLVADVHEAGDRIATLAGTTTYPGNVRLNILVSTSTRQVDLTVPLVDKLAAAFDTTAATDVEREDYRAEGSVGHLRVLAYTFVPKPEDPEKAALAARVAELEAQIAGGTR